MSAKFSYQYSHGKGLDCFKNFTDPCQGGPGWTNAHLFAINDTHTFSPSLLLNVTLGFTRGVWHIDAYNPHGVDRSAGRTGIPLVSAEQRIHGGSRHLYRSVPMLLAIPTSAPIRTATTGWVRTRDNFGHARQGTRHASRSSSALTAGSTRLITFRPTPPSASSASMQNGTVRLPVRNRRPAAATPWPVS